MSTRSKAKAIERLQKALSAIPELKAQRRGSPEFEKWHRNTGVAIINTFGESARHVKDFTEITYSLGFYFDGMPDSDFEEAYRGGLDSAASVLQSMIEEVHEYWDDDAKEEAIAIGEPAVVADDTQSHQIFIVHGRDDGSKEAVARFIETLGLRPVVLHEQPNQGRTLIEKFERHAAVGFAIAVLTPDDVGALAGNATDLKPRARQNVILELGYFIGYLGRRKVCALVKEGVEIPTDISGVVYVPLDIGGAWRLALVRELRASGLDVDANLAL